jgi:hypothetical protein
MGMRISGPKFLERALVHIRYWLFPSILLVGWMLAASYTLFVTSGAPPPVPEVKLLAPRPLPVAAARPNAGQQVPLGG